MDTPAELRELPLGLFRLSGEGFSMAPITVEQWLQYEVSRQPLLGAAVEILPGVLLSRLVADVAYRAWHEAQLRLLPTPEVQVLPELPPACRPCLPVIQAALLLDLPDDQFLELSRQGIDLRDLSETELGWLEDVKVKTVQTWRRAGSGPPYRKQGPSERAPVVYPILNLRDWRRAHRATNTTRRIARRGRPGA